MMFAGTFPQCWVWALPKVLLKMEVAAFLEMYEATQSSSNMVPACSLEQCCALNAKAFNAFAILQARVLLLPVPAAEHVGLC